MTQKTTVTERAYGSLWFPKSNGEAQTLNVRVLHRGVDEFLQTSTHWVNFDTKSGGKGNIRVECAKKGSFGTTRDAIFCPLDAGEQYGAPKNKQWFWVQDLTDGGLKYVEMPYSIRQQLEILQTSALRGAPLMNAKLQFIKSGKGLNTQYQVIPEMEPLADFDLRGYLQTLGLDVLPPLVGTENFPPIWSLDEEKLNNVAKGIMPWQGGGGKEGPGQPEQNIEAYNPYGNPAPLQPAEPQAQATNVKQGEGHYAPTQAPTQAPIQAPVLKTAPSDYLPQSFVPEAPVLDATAMTQPNVPYGSDGKQETVKQTDDLEGKKVFF